MLRIILPVILEVALIYFLIGHSFVRMLLPRKKRHALMVRDFRHHVKKIRVVNSDRLDAKTLRGLDETLKELDAFRQAGNYDPEATAKVVKKADESVAAIVPPAFRKRGMIAEYLEILVVALGVAFGIRATFMQPFKIPTGSMQPTLYGIHFVADETVDVPGPLGKALHWFHLSRRYVDLEIRESGFVRRYWQVPSKIPFFPRTAFIIGRHKYILPGKPVDAVKCNDKLKRYFQVHEQNRVSLPVSFEQGETLAKGYLMSGDHVFVNRASLNFSEPERGKITVFMTDGILYNGQPLNGRFYSKRLVGMPGDELRINDQGQLLVKEPGAAEFRRVDGEDKPAFRRINSRQGGYHGYVANMGDTQLYLRPGKSYTIPDDHYFMLGDNSSHSLDSRFWGAVPRKNLVGHAALVWWPATRRWGLADSVEPVENPANVSSSGQVE